MGYFPPENSFASAYWWLEVFQTQDTKRPLTGAKTLPGILKKKTRDPNWLWIVHLIKTNSSNTHIEQSENVLQDYGVWGINNSPWWQIYFLDGTTLDEYPQRYWNYGLLYRKQETNFFSVHEFIKGILIYQFYFMLISIFVALCIRKSEENKIERYVGFFPFSIEEFFRFCQDFRKQLVNELLWVLSNVIESMKDKPAFHFENNK